MKSVTAEKLQPDYEPVAIPRNNIRPEGAMQIKPEAQACIMPFFAQIFYSKDIFTWE
jgi:hypothetical protein